MSEVMVANDLKVVKNRKRLFLKLGTCSQTIFYILNRYYEHPMETEERAVDPLAGGILSGKHQGGDDRRQPFHDSHLARFGRG